MAIRCPRCDAPVLSRRNPVCATCREPLPAGWVMDRAELREVEADERDRHRSWLAREEGRRARRDELARIRSAEFFADGAGFVAGLGGW